MSGDPSMLPAPAPSGGELAPHEQALIGDSLLGTNIRIPPAQQTNKEPVAMVWLPGKKKKRKRNFVELPGRGPLLFGQPDNFVETRRSEGPVGTFLEENYQEPGGPTTADSVINWVYDDKKLAEIKAYLEKKGFQVGSFEDVYKLWSEAVGHAADAFMKSQIQKSPFDMLDLMAPTEEEIAARGPWKGLGYDQTMQNVEFADMAPETARGIIANALSNALGRGPSDQEIEDFASRANAIVSANPRTTSQTTHYAWDASARGPGEGDYVPTGSVTQSSGPDSQGISDMVSQEAVDTAKQNPEYGAYQASTTYMNALMQLIMGGG